jgi:N-acetylmuramoyl-L-alanine amidase
MVLLVPMVAAGACTGASQPRAASVQTPSPAASASATVTASPSPASSPTPTATHVTAAPAPAPAKPAPAPAKPAAKPAPKPATPSPPSPPIPAGTSGLAGRIVVIDPGHNGQNYAHTAEINRLVDIGNGTKACDTTGTAARDGYAEAAYNLDVAQRLAALLTSAGARVVLTRSDNNGWGPCINERAAIGNDAHADVAISIHADGSTTGRGFHVIYPASLPGLTDAIAVPSQQLAVDIRDAYAAGTGMPYSTYIGRAALDQRSDLGGLNLSRVPKVFIETGNLHDTTDAALLEDPGFRQRAAQSLLAGLQAFLSRK